MLTIDFAGHVVEVEPATPFVIGRDGDLAISDNPYLHRRFLELRREDGIWWLTNLGAHITATVDDAVSGLHTWLTPGARTPVANGTTSIRFTAGPTSYELFLMLDDEPVAFAPTADHDDDGTETLGRLRLTDDQRLMLVVLAESALRNGISGMADIPSAATGAQRVGWTQKKFEKKIDNVCDRLTSAGVRGLKGDLGNQAVGRRARLVEYVVSTRLVTGDDLDLLDTGDPACGS